MPAVKKKKRKEKKAGNADDFVQGNVELVFGAFQEEVGQQKA